MVTYKYKNINNPSYTELSGCLVQIPELCPICGVANNPSISILFVDTINHVKTFGFKHTCSGCYKNVLSLNTSHIENNKKYANCLLVYPSIEPIKFDEKISNLSPRFVQLYNQAHHCEEHNFTDLAGMGYRAALEVLIKDYALDFELDTKENIAKLNLNRSIETFFKTDMTALIAADVVRIIGNDFTHWEKNLDFSLEELKQYLNIFITNIQFKLMIKHPPVSRNK